jgi:excisionase family DNA binding protein
MSPSEDLSEYSLSVPEVAKMLGVQPMTIRRWIGDGRLPARRVPGTKPYKIRQADVDALVQGSEVTTAASGSEGMAGMDTAAMLIDPTETDSR